MICCSDIKKKGFIKALVRDISKSKLGDYYILTVIPYTKTAPIYYKVREENIKNVEKNHIITMWYTMHDNNGFDVWANLIEIIKVEKI